MKSKIFVKAQCGCIGMEMYDGRFYCLKPCDGDYTYPHGYDPGIREDIRRDRGEPEPISSGEEELMLAEINKLIRRGNMYSDLRDSFKTMLDLG